MRALLALAVLGGCAVQRAPVAPQALAYVVGSAYQAGGTWYYPRERFQYEATGLAEVTAGRTGLTVNGEAFDPSTMAAAHQTLQLPAIARVTNLETGLQVLVRINDRGPASPARLLGLTRRAAELLGIGASGVARVRVQVEDGPSQALRDALQGATGQIQAAPIAAVTQEALALPAGAERPDRPRVAVPRPASAPAAPAAPGPLPQTALRVPANPGQLWIRAGEFGQAGYANQIQAKLYGMPAQVEREQAGRSVVFRVRAGPFATVAAADAALDQALRAGVTDARIVVE